MVRTGMAALAALTLVACGESHVPADAADADAAAALSCEDRPTAGAACAADGDRCEYGEECCCGGCGPSTLCWCAAGLWQCSGSDLCYMPMCADTGMSVLDAAVDSGTPDAMSDAATDAASDAATDASDGGTVDASTTGCPPGSTATATGCTDPVAACASANVLWLSGASWVHTGTTTATGAWAVRAWDWATAGSGIDTVELQLSRPAGSTPDRYQVVMSSDGLGTPLTTGVYEMAYRHPFASSMGVPGLDLTSTGRGCNRVSGRFQVHTLTVASDGHVEFLASFDHYCEERELVRGCVRYDGPATP